MDERIMQFRVGVVVLAVGLIAGFLVLLFGHFPSLMRKTYTVYIQFPQSPGVTPETPIKKNGVLIGRVTKVELEDTERRVRVTAEIYSEFTIWHDEVVRLVVTLLGDADLEVEPANQAGLPKTKVQPGETIAGITASNPLQAISNMEGDLSAAARSLTSAGDEVAKLSHSVNEVVSGNHDQFARVLSKTETTLDTFTKTMSSVDEIVGDPQVRDNLRRSLTELPQTFTELHNSLVMFQNTTKLADENLKNLQGFTAPLGDRGEQMIRSFDSSIRRLDEMLAQMVAFTRQLNSREGSLGQLLNNPELYQQLSDAARRADELIRDARPVVDNAKVFTDKIARHPELLGVRGAVSPSSGIK